MESVGFYEIHKVGAGKGRLGWMRRDEWYVQCAHEVLDSLDVGLPWDGSFCHWWRLGVPGCGIRIRREDNRNDGYVR